MPPFVIDGFEYLGSVTSDEICETIYEPDGDINQWLDEQGVERADTTDGICLAVGLAGGIMSSPTGLGAVAVTVVGTFGCQSGKLACDAESFVTGLSGCGSIEVAFYGREFSSITATGVTLPSEASIMMVPMCESLSASEVIDAIESAGGTVADNGLVDEISDTGSSIIDTSTDIGSSTIDTGTDAAENWVDGATDTGGDIVDSTADNVGDAIDQGRDLIGI